MPIQWFPGHMAKARREIKEQLNLVDLVIELRDARIPYSSKNPMVDEIVGNKPRLILLTKSTLADKEETKKWVKDLTGKNTICLEIDCISNYNINKVHSYAKLALKEEFDRRKQRGMNNETIKAIIVGIPNVGKSTFINTLAKRKAAKVGNKPGVTKGQSWIKVNPELIFLDTPGILWPKFEDQEVGAKLAICGSIKDEILDLNLIALKAINYLKNRYNSYLIKRYNLNEDVLLLDDLDILEEIGRKRGCLVKGGVVDLDRVQVIVLNDFRGNLFGPVTLESPEEFIGNEEIDEIIE